MNFSKPLFLVFSLLTFAATLTSQNAPFGQKASFEPKGAELLCSFKNCGPADKISLWKFNGVLFKHFMDAEKTGEGSYSFSLPADTEGFLYVGTEKKQKMPVIFGHEEKIVLEGNCLNLRTSKFSDSPTNTAYNDMMGKVGNFQRQVQSLMRKYVGVKNEPLKKAELEKEMAALDQQQLDLLNDLKINHPFVAKVYGGFVQLSYPNNKGNYINDYQHFVGDFFKHVDLKDKDYNSIPPIYESFKNYATTLSSIQLPAEDHKNLLEDILNQLPKDSQAYQYALGAFIGATKSKNHSNFSYFAQKYLDQYSKTLPEEAASIETQLASAKSFVIGGDAPDIAANNPDGELISLKDYKGKVVLIDFWASWCGPCRKENPNIVRMYNKYKDKGFEVLGVSLDRSKEKWVSAIEKDGLIWPHMSDLKGWKSELSAIYSVTSIPHTVLVDKEGKILARNLRGKDLETALSKLFDE